MNTVLNQFIQYGLKNFLIKHEDVDYAVNRMLDILKIDSFTPEEVTERSIYDILDDLLAYAVSKGIIEDTIDNRDLLDTRMMDTLMPRPSEVITKFDKLYDFSPETATDYYYDLSIKSNYIRKSRVDKNIQYNAETKYGPLNISINLSKPEKDPRDIAKAKLVKATGYPKCLLCKENVGYAGHALHPARQTHRIIPLQLNGDSYYLQYSPYVYYNEHCIVLNEQHVPMEISRDTFIHLLDFIDLFPHYMLGSNADLPIVGGSILSHDHYQGGRAHFPIEDARVLKSYRIPGYESVSVDMVYWPLSTLRLSSRNREQLIDLATHIHVHWIQYEDAQRGIIPFTGSTRHQTVTPIARMKNGVYVMDIVLRNNHTTEQYPLGLFHPHPEYHHIKKENIGLIEVMGLAILPGRLKDEMKDMAACLRGEQRFEEIPSLEKHKDWYEQIKYTQRKDVEAFLREEIGRIFMHVLEDAGVFKMDEDGIAGFDQFVRTL